MHCLLCLVICGLLLPTLPSLAQTSPDTLPPASFAVYQQYMQKIGGASLLYSGAEYEGSYPMVQGSPFLDDSSFRYGTICYDGVFYYNIPLAYDLVRNELLIRGFQQLALRLAPAKVCGFRLAGHHYVHLSPGNENRLPNDLYELLFQGEARVYARRTKNIVRALHAEGQDRLVEQVVYYLEKENRFTRLNKPGDLLAAFPGQKNALKAFWKAQHLDFKKAPEPFLIQTLTYWTQLKK